MVDTETLDLAIFTMNYLSRKTSYDQFINGTTGDKIRKI